jgi:hypothetical protein
MHLVACQFQRALAPDTLLGIVGEGGEAVNLFEDAQVESRALNVLEAAESLVVLGENANDLLGGVVGGCLSCSCIMASSICGWSLN